MSQEAFYTLLSVAILGNLTSILYIIKAFNKKDLGYIVASISRSYVGIISILVLLFGFDRIDKSYLNIGMTLILSTDLINHLLYFVGKKYRNELEYKRALYTLSMLEAKYRTIVEKSLVGFYVINEKGKFELVNERFCEITGYTQTELLNMTFADIVTEDCVQAVRENIRKRFSGEISSVKYSVNIKTKSGKVVPVTKLGLVTDNGHRTITGNILPH